GRRLDANTHQIGPKPAVASRAKPGTPGNARLRHQTLSESNYIPRRALQRPPLAGRRGPGGRRPSCPSRRSPRALSLRPFPTPDRALLGLCDYHSPRSLPQESPRPRSLPPSRQAFAPALPQSRAREGGRSGSGGPFCGPGRASSGQRWCGGRRYGHGTGRLTAGLGEGPEPRIWVAAARARPAPWPPPPPPRSISRSCTRSSAASMKTYKGCPSGCWGLLGPLAEMEEELRYAPLSFRNPMMSKLRNYRKDLAKLHREVRSTPLTATPGGRGDMKYGIYALENEHMNRLQSQRAMLLQGTESLNRATQSIERSHRIATETDQIGSEIIEELGEQRDQLERTKSRSDNQQAAAFHYHLTGARHPGRPGLLQILSQPLNFYREGFVDQNFDLVNA
uniref:t-SNARE coiled-coil homology domain-containing protein n=1 Tax=Macaca fascicularis TaxID=9541 RepID=A0A2K5V5G0_MACFA